jgi:hypothetical protein
MAVVAAVAAGAGGCSTSRGRNLEAVSAYYAYEFTDAREALRGDALLRNDEDVLLNTLRLGVAAMADGDAREAELALGRSFDLLSTAGLNADRTTAAVWVNEGVRIWKGEPFEQALGYWWASAHYATRGDWENARAAIVNANFRLRDFGADQDEMDVAERVARDDAAIDAYDAVENDFALGRLMQGLASRLSRTPGADEAFAAALTLRPDLAPVVDAITGGDPDTYLLIDYGKGPTKQAYGPDNALARWAPQDVGAARVRVRRGDAGVDGPFPAAADVNALAADFRWNALEDVRRAKSIIGRTLTDVGLVVALSNGSNQEERGLVGLGMILAGSLLRSGAEADVRYIEFAPQLVFVVPLTLGETTELEVIVDHPSDGVTSRMVLPDVEPGTAARPRAIYLRLHGPGSPQPGWLTSGRVAHGNDHAGVRPGELPWLLGGTDVSTPSPAVMDRYRAAGLDPAVTLEQYRNALAAEGVRIGSGAGGGPGERRNPTYRHVLEGGRGLFTPTPDSMGYRRLFGVGHRAHQPQSREARAIAERLAPDPMLPGATARAGVSPPDRLSSPSSESDR